MRLLASFLLLLLVPQVTKAGDCAPVFSRQRTFCDNVAAVKVFQPVQAQLVQHAIVQPVIQNVALPQFVAGGHCGQHALVAQPVLDQTFVYSPLVAPSSYYSVGDEYRIKNIVAAVVQELQTKQTVVTPPQLQTSESVWQQQKLAFNTQQNVCVDGSCHTKKTCDCPSTPAVPTTPVTPDKPVTPEPPKPADNSKLEQEVLKIFANTAGGQKSCIECHGQTNKLGGSLRLVVPNTAGGWSINPALTKSEKAQIVFNADKGLMPPSVLSDPQNPKNAHAVSNEGIATLTEWARTPK